MSPRRLQSPTGKKVARGSFFCFTPFPFQQRKPDGWVRYQVPGNNSTTSILAAPEPARTLACTPAAIVTPD
jgi:hypothetical protein